MDLLTTRKPPTPSQRLLGSLLIAEKSHLDAFLQTLALSHNSNAALAAYASAGRDQGLSLAVGGVVGVLGEGEPWQESYASTLSSTRLALKEIRDAEEQLANITRDRDILVQRMIKQTKKKPSKSELRNNAASSSGRPSSDSYSTMSSPSVSSFDKTGKLEEAQLELAGCEDTLRREEVKVEQVRRRVLKNVVEERLKSLEGMGNGLEKAAQRGLVELQTYLSEGAPFEDHHSHRQHKPYTPSLESESPSLAPSQSVSQNGRDHDSSDDEDHHARRQASTASSLRTPNRKSRGLASVIESSGDSSDDNNTNLQVVENRPPGRQTASDVGGARQRTISAPLSSSPTAYANGSVSRRSNGTTKPPPAPSASWNHQRNATDSSSDSESGTLRGGNSNRRSQSDIGVGTKTSKFQSRKGGLARRSSSSSFGGGSDNGSIRTKRGFFASFKHFFVGNASSNKNGARGGRSGSPDSMQRAPSSSIQWQTRTDRNVRKAGSGGLLQGSSRGGGADSSDEDERRGGRVGGNGDLVAVTNVGRTAGKKGGGVGGDQWVVEPVGGVRPGVKRNTSSKSTIKGSTTLVANGNSSKLNKKISSSDVGLSSKPSSSKLAPLAHPLGKPISTPASAPVSRSNTVKSSKSTTTISKSSKNPSTSASTNQITTSNPPAAVSSSAPKRSASTSAVAKGKGNAQGGQTGTSLKTLVEIKAPRSSNPSSGLVLPRAPGSSIIPSTLSPPPRAIGSSSPSSIPQALAQSPPDNRRSSSYTSNTSAPSPSRPHSAYANTSQTTSPNAPNPHHSPQHRLSTAAPPRSAMRQPKKEGSVTSSNGSNTGTLLQAPPALVVARAPSPMANVNPTETDNESVYETGLEDNDGKDESDDDGYATDRARSPLPSPAPAPTAAQEATVVRRKSVRMDVPPTPGTDDDSRSDFISQNGPRVPSKQRPASILSNSSAATAQPGFVNGSGGGYEPGGWSTRIGTRDSSDEEDEDEGEYAIARRAMERATRKFEGAGRERTKESKGKGRA